MRWGGNRMAGWKIAAYVCHVCIPPLSGHDKRTCSDVIMIVNKTDQTTAGLHIVLLVNLYDVMCMLEFERFRMKRW